MNMCFFFFSLEFHFEMLLLLCDKFRHLFASITVCYQCMRAVFPVQLNWAFKWPQKELNRNRKLYCGKHAPTDTHFLLRNAFAVSVTFIY